MIVVKWILEFIKELLIALMLTIMSIVGFLAVLFIIGLPFFFLAYLIWGYREF